MAKADGADGVDLDYESLWGKDREAFSQFVELMAAECHQRGLQLAIAVHPKQKEPGDWDGEIAQDWARIGAAVDYFRPMCYDQNNSIAPHGPIASSDWIQKTMELAVKLVPASKIEIGIPVYGYDRKDKKSIPYTWSEFEKVEKLHGPAHRDPASQELTFQVQYDIAKKMGLRGLAVWRLGAEDPRFWTAFQKNR
jgi:spore germination protein YaaH